jgi:hypothetical protein
MGPRNFNLAYLDLGFCSLEDLFFTKKKGAAELLVVVLINFKVTVQQRTICIIVQHVITLLTEKARARRGQCIPISNLCCPVYIADATLADSCTWMPS